MESFFSRYRNALVLIAVLLAQVIGLATQVRRPGQSPQDKGGVRLIRAWAMDIVTPPERLLHWTGLGIRGVWTDYIDLIHVRQQDQQLKAQLGQVRLEEDSLAEDARQAVRLQSLLGFQEKYIYKTVAAQVIGASGTEQSHVLFIDKGSDEGIRPDMPVITPDGIIGKTRDVFAHTSQVLEIDDETSGAGVILANTRIEGVLSGNSWGQPEIINVSPDDRIKPGEPVITSGGDGIYPRGLPVGSVVRAVSNPEGTLVNILVKPAANLSALEEVLVIVSLGNQMPAQMQQDLSQAQAPPSTADILAARLPSAQQPATQNGQAQNGQAQNGTAAAGSTGLPPPPPQPPPAIHTDRFTAGDTPSGADLVPGQPVTPEAGANPATASAPAARTAPAASSKTSGSKTSSSKKSGAGRAASPKSKTAAAPPQGGN